MKTKIILVALITIAISAGCNKANSGKNEKDLLNFKTNSKANLNLKFFNSQSTTHKNVSVENNIGYNSQVYDNTSFDSIARILTSGIRDLSTADINSITKIVLYGESSPLANRSFKSLSLVTQTEQGVFFRHFINEGGAYKLFRDSVIKFSSYCERDLIALLQSDQSFLSFSFPTIEILEKQTIRNLGFEYQKKLSSSLIAMNIKYEAFVAPEAGYCKKCGGGKSGECVTNEVTQEKYCSNQSCRVSVINSIEIAADVDSIYSFRDSIMRKYNFGKKYIAYYDYISFVINSFERPATISSSEELGFLLSTLKVAYNFQYGGNDAIIVSEDYFEKALSYMERYRAYITNPYFLEVLDDISQDLGIYKNQTKEVIKLSIR
ncbi:hypothetical protein BH11BAC4_BH11BAC4_05850 [soil metagenome]